MHVVNLQQIGTREQLVAKLAYCPWKFVISFLVMSLEIGTRFLYLLIFVRIDLFSSVAGEGGG